MRHTLSILFLFFVTTLVGQTSASADLVRQNLKGATISNPIKKIKPIYFSNTQKQDTIVLTVASGLISQSKSQIEIKSFNGKTIYSELFKTDYVSS